MEARIIFLLLVVLVSLSDAKADANSEATNVLKSAVKEEISILSYATGDLNNDGLDDWVGIILITSPNTFQRLYVLTRDANRGLAFAEASREVGYTDCGGTCGSEVSIAKGSLYVSQFDRGGWGSASATTQFKFYKNKWRALGRKTFKMDMVKGDLTESDKNLLTGEYASAYTKDFASGEAAAPTKRERGIAGTEYLLLKDFGLDQF